MRREHGLGQSPGELRSHATRTRSKSIVPIVHQRGRSEDVGLYLGPYISGAQVMRAGQVASDGTVGALRTPPGAKRERGLMIL